MKKFAFAAMFALAACSQTEDIPVAEETAAAPEVAVPMAIDGMPAAGTYEVTSADGQVATFVLNADGTYSASMDGQEAMSGTYTMETPEVSCFTATGATEASCSNETMSADGVWTSTDAADPTIVSTIVRKM